MALRFLLDEHLRGPLWNAIKRHNLRGGLSLDAVCVGEYPELPLGSSDREILAWAEREDRILITEDRNTMAAHLLRHIQAGRRSPGVFVVALGCSIPQLVSHLELVAHAGLASDFENAITFVP